MDKKGWTYKKLNEICDKSSSNIVINKLDSNEGEYPLYGASGIVKSIDFYQQDKPYIGIVKDGSGVGRVNIYPAYSSLVGTMQYIFPKDKSQLKYIKYFLEKLDLKHYVSGAAIPHIYFRDYGKEIIPIPTKETQQLIVSELDKINDSITMLQEQVKDLDELTQSIFYSTFGDPTINEKGWQVMKLRDGFSYIKNGANIKQDKNASGIPITRIETLSGGVFNRDRLGYADIFSIEKYSNYLMNDGDILMSHINSKAYIGRSVIYRKRENEIIIHGMNLLRLVVIPDLINPTYINAFFKSDYFRNKVARIRKDAVNQSSMAISDLKDIDILVPPLTIQNSYASKVSSIEDAKDSINIQIKEMQTLLSARMQYWFE